MKLKFRYAARQPRVLIRVREVELDQEELQLLLDEVRYEEGDLQPTARELLDYLDGRGEFALVVDLAARHEDVRLLFERLTRFVYYSENPGRVIEHGLVEEGDEEGFTYRDARTVP